MRPGTTTETRTDAAGGREPAEGRPDLGIPGADHPAPAPDRQDELPERLGERMERGPKGGVATGEPDLLPDVEVPEETM